MVAAFTIRRCLQGWQALPVPGASSARHVLLLAVLGTTAALGQDNITDPATNSTLTLVADVGPLTPANSSTLTSGQIQFRVRSQDATGYHVNAIATFTPSVGATINGGNTIEAKDIGIGIISITTSSSVITPRADTPVAGFNYDPETASVTDGGTPFNNIAGGKATLADLSTTKKILSGPKVSGTSTASGASNYLTVTLSLAALPQYFSPSTFSMSITLTIGSGP